MNYDPNQAPGQPSSSHEADFHSPSGVSSEERQWGLASHIGTLVSAWALMGFVLPLVILLTKGNSSPFVRAHAVESLNFQITLLIGLVIYGFLTLITFGLASILVIPFGLVALIFIVIATVTANDGRDYRYPLTIRLVK